MRILIADDDEICRITLRQHLEKLDHEVVSANSGEQALEEWEKKEFPLIISNWRMEGGDGLDLCRGVRSRKNRDYTYFILLTICSSKQNYLEAMDSGVDDFLTKPMNKEDLSIRLRVAERILGFTRQADRLMDLIPICSYCKKIRTSGIDRSSMPSPVRSW
jgi:sigma-B regulation protein RsbU (phosphoserine phosphatase)